MTENIKSQAIVETTNGEKIIAYSITENSPISDEAIMKIKEIVRQDAYSRDKSKYVINTEILDMQAEQA